MPAASAPASEPEGQVTCSVRPSARLRAAGHVGQALQIAVPAGVVAGQAGQRRQSRRERPEACRP